MKPMDVFNEQILSEENARKLLNDEEYSEFLSLDYYSKISLLRDLLEKPIAEFTIINELYFRSKWAELIHHIYGNNPVALLEIASGDADMIPQTIARTNPGSMYTTANMNKKLNSSLINKTKNLDLNVNLIDDDAAYIKKYIGIKAADIIAFQHGANDVLQAILCNQAGIDTIYADWMETLPQMIKILQQEIKQDTLEKNTKPAFLKLIDTLLEVLKDDGIIAINHYMFQLDLDWGYPADLFENFIPIIRKWLPELKNCEEIFYDNFEKQWWIFLKKCDAESKRK